LVPAQRTSRKADAAWTAHQEPGSGVRKKNQKVEFKSDIQEEKTGSGISMYLMQMIRRFDGFASFP